MMMMTSNLVSSMIALTIIFFVATRLVAAGPCDDSLATTPGLCDTPQHWSDHPVLCHWLELASQDTETFTRLVSDWAAAHNLLADIDMDVEPKTMTTEVQRRGLQRENNQTDAPSPSRPSAPTPSSPTRPSPNRPSPSPPSPDTREPSARQPTRPNKKQLPVVFAHGIGDSCYNDGFLRLLQRTRDVLGNDVYVTCIPTGDNQQDDTKNGFFLNWNASVDVFHSKVKRDDRLQDGFHAIGLSQGANLIRGYIAKYNDPPVDTFIAVNGVNAGIGAVPYCRPDDTAKVVGVGHWHSICDLLQEQASHSAYTCFAQHHSFPSNYWRDPRLIATERYQIYSQLAWFNQEGYDLRQDFKDNWNKTKQFVWVLAEDDGLVWPREGEWWGAPDPRDPFNNVLNRTETRWYRDDTFGLKTAEEAGKNVYESFSGDHLKFSNEEYDRWIKKYIRNKD